MTILGYCAANTSSSGTRGKGIDHRYQAPYLVSVDDPEDGPAKILSYLEGEGFITGAPYSYGITNADVDLLSYLDGVVRCARKPGSADPWVWDVVFSYGPIEPQTNFQNAAGDGWTTNPLLARYDISAVTTTIQIPAEDAWNIDAFPQGPALDWAYRRAANTKGPVVNSAGSPYDPPLLVDYAETVLRVAGNLDFYNQDWLRFATRMNSGTLHWNDELENNYGFLQQTFDTWTVKCTGASATYQRINNVAFYRYEYEFRFRRRLDANTPFDGWLERVVDRGLSRNIDPATTSVPTGTAFQQAIRDVNDARVPEPILLDGSGQPLQRSETNTPDPVYFRWRTLEEDVFSVIPLSIFDTGPAP